MIKSEIINQLKSLNFLKDEYWVITGTAMVLHGLRENTHDIDLGCTKTLADKLKESGYPCILLDDGTRKITIGDNIEIFENWLYDQVEIIDSIPVISVKGLIAMKKSIGREKDLKDIQLIERYLDDHEGEAICPSFQNR